ncbi:hypothetical protein P3X46_029181 [Hevea brasiliensis]|uniref:Uncharacterized protein n=1 Tax=Hevea brasiliensis TaxID=3981 RepID=A0ABQ9KSS8_HEVBR|nr:snakin-2 [Hevea brasiliensis]KAJ9146969.1 hypothetical protein P3X46_029181 [Hevea brasiliensis]
MAFSRYTVTASLLLVSLLLLHLAEAQEKISINGANEPAHAPSSQTIDCGVACEGRCKMSKRLRLCQRACGSCCAKCKCVPPGTYGNLEFCPCYANLTTRKQVRKCP